MVSDQIVSLMPLPTKAGASFAVPSIVGLMRNNLFEVSASLPVLYALNNDFIASDWNDDVHVV